MSKFRKEQIARAMERESSKIVHLMYVPFTGLGLYNGFRGNRWLKNRVKIFKQFVLPSLLGQTDRNFTLWISWRYEEQSNKIVQDFEKYLKDSGLKVVFTYGGCCFWDDKYPDEEARVRLLGSLHQNLSQLLDTIGEADKVIMTLQPSDDCYHRNGVLAIKQVFKDSPLLQAFGFKRGYVMNYNTGELGEWNPTTNPPFFSIMFPKDTFVEPLKHAEYTGPYKSHEYIGEKLRYAAVNERGFLVGTHGENISTVFKHPFTGKVFEGTEKMAILADFGLAKAGNLSLPFSLRRKIFRGLPYMIQRKLRYWAGEKKWILRPIFSIIYNGLRS